VRERPPAEAGHEDDEAEDEQRLLEGELNEAIYHGKNLKKELNGDKMFSILRKTTMEHTMQLQNLSPPPRPPKRYWDDSEWAIQNIQALTEKYPDEWIAVFEERVAAHNADLGQVLAAVESHGIESPVIKFIEKGIHVTELRLVSDYPQQQAYFEIP
jgi:hypothetical protein